MQLRFKFGIETIFPKRKIGRLSEGYEASFVVLRENPLENFDSIKDIQLRFKQGVFIGQFSAELNFRGH